MRKKSSEEEIFQEMSRRFSGGDNFDHTDVNYRWRDDNFNIDKALEACGHEPESDLESIIYALIKGQRPDLSVSDLDKEFKVAYKAITGTYNRGRVRKDRYILLKRIALAWHKAEYDARIKGEADPEIVLRDLVRPIVQSYISSPGAANDPTGELSLIQKLEDDFNKNREVILIHATSDSDHRRMMVPEKVERVLAAFEGSGFSVDRSAIKKRPIRNDL
ncbi:hypothetical protein [Paracoccus versutus]